ncbi:MAG: glutaredoxin [Candidatus Omnitrophica bacterium]|nr:glutaredoxin [Candidatus Omnitrophota bacterium]
MPKVVIYTTTYCPHCRRAKELLKRKEIHFQEIDLTEDHKKREELQEKTGWMTVPIIMAGEELIGGADELYALEAEGKLEKKLLS